VLSLLSGERYYKVTLDFPFILGHFNRTHSFIKGFGENSVTMDMKFGMVIVAVLLLGLVLSPASGAESSDNQEWPTFHGNWARTGFTDVTLPENLVWLWSFDLENHPELMEIESSPAVAYGKVYFVAKNGYVYSLDAESGELVWRYQTGGTAGPYLGPSPTVVNGVVYVGSWDNHVYALDAENGELIWRFEVDIFWTLLGVDGAPAVVDNRVYVGSWNGYFYCLNAKNGELIWSYSDGDGKMGHVSGSPAVVNGVIYFGAAAGDVGYTGTVYALNAENGGLIWKYYIGDEICASPAVVNNVVYIGVGFMGHLLGDGMYALDASTGELLWYFDTNNEPLESSAAVENGKLYFGSHTKKIYALNAENGDEIWSFETDSWILSSPAITGDKVYVGAGVNFYVLDAANGRLIQKLYSGGSVVNSPAIAYGKVYVASRYGIFCYGPSPEFPQTEMTTWLFVLACIGVLSVIGFFLFLKRK